MTVASETATPVRRRLAIASEALAAGITLAAFALYGWTQWRNFTPATVEPDCEAYFILGKRLAHFEAPGRAGEEPLLHPDHAWVRNPRGELLPKYAPGYPLLVGLAWRIGGDRAAFAVSPLLGALALLAVFLLFREWMPTGPATIAGLLISLHPMFLEYSAYPLAHAAEMAFAAWGFYAVWRWKRRGGTGAGIAAGLCLGCAAMARPAALLLGLPLAAAVADTLARAPRPRRQALRRCAAPALAWSLPLLLLAAYQWRWFGGPLSAGYALSGEQAGFGWNHAIRNGPVLFAVLARDLAPGALALAWCGSLLVGAPWERAARLLWLLPLLLLHLAYYWAPPGWVYGRFLLALLPLLIGAACLAVWQLPGRAAARTAALLVFAAGSAAPGVMQLREGAWAGRARATAARDRAAAAAHIESWLPEDAVLFVAAPLDRGFGALRRYEVFRLPAFQPGFVEQEMPESTGPRAADGRTIRVQPERRRELAELHRRLGPGGLARHRAEIAAGRLNDGRTVAFLLPEPPRSIPRDLVEAGLTLRRETSFDLGAGGRWVLYRVEFAPSGTTGG